MTSAAPSPDPTLAGPVEVCIDRPVLSLDRPFTYDLPADLGATVGSIVQVLFHGRRVHGWGLGPTAPVPRMEAVRGLLSPIPAFDGELLAFLRWIAERYVAPLAAVIDRAVPPRVAGEERRGPLRVRPTFPPAVGTGTFDRYAGGAELSATIRAGDGATVALRPAPNDDPALAVEAVGIAVAAGRTAIVVVPEADPDAATTAALRRAYGDAVAVFLGGDRRERYRMWVEIRAGRFPIVVGTQPAVFAPLRDLGLLYVAREGHGQHREERSPHTQVRDLASARARLSGATAILSAYVPTLEASALADATVTPRDRAWPPVEIVAPGPEGRAPRLVRAILDARRTFLYEPLRGYGVARVCRGCGEAAACGACRGTLRQSRGTIVCTVCGAPGRCPSCGGTTFGVARGGVERVEEWAQGLRGAPVRPATVGPLAAGESAIVVGGLEALKDEPPMHADLVGILSADAVLRRAGIDARERALIAWAEAAARAAPAGRVIVQTTAPGDPAIQALVGASPERFARAEAPRLAEAGFPPGAAVFRVEGAAAIADAIAALPHRSLLVTRAGDPEGTTVCLAVLDPETVPAFGRLARDLAGKGILRRVEASPHL
ncbi:MAG: hypothetical protein ACKOKE_00960 [Actinomycetota bacterium]